MVNYERYHPADRDTHWYTPLRRHFRLRCPIISPNMEDYLTNATPETEIAATNIVFAVGDTTTRAPSASTAVKAGNEKDRRNPCEKVPSLSLRLFS